MENIAVAFDFSKAAYNGLYYAASLASDLKEPLTLFHIIAGGESEQTEANRSEEAMHRLAEEIHQKYHLHCSVKVGSTLLRVENALAEAVAPYKLLVMGTNGAENYYQHFMGSYTLNTMRVAHTPVLMVPEQSTYKKVKKIVYAFHPDTNPIFLIDELKSLAISFDANVTLLYVLPGTDEKFKKELNRIALAVQARSTKNFPLFFEHRELRSGFTVADTLMEFTRNNDCNWLAVSQHQRSLRDQFFKEDVLENLSRLADFPVLMFRH